jgi:hypothetical protein
MKKLLAVVALAVLAAAANAMQQNVPLPAGCLTFNAAAPTLLTDGTSVYLQVGAVIPLAVCTDEAAKPQPVGATYVIVISAACHPRTKFVPGVSGPLAYDAVAKKCGPLKQVPARGTWTAY